MKSTEKEQNFSFPATKHKLVIAEKPMLAKAILDAIPGTAKSIKAGERVFYTEKGDYLVVALAGHVLQLKEPEDYDPKYKKWTLDGSYS